MEEEFSILENQLKSAIAESLQNHIQSNAVFLAERLLAEKDSETNRNILAECYIAENKIYKAYYVLKDCKSDINRYKFALTCLRLNKLKEAEKALISEQPNKQFIFQQNQQLDQVPNGSYGYYLLGLVYERQQKFQDSKECFLKALELNPILWSAYEKLCKMGEMSITSNKVFNDTRYKQYEINTQITGKNNPFQTIIVGKVQMSQILQTKDQAAQQKDDDPSLQEEDGNANKPRYMGSIKQPNLTYNTNYGYNFDDSNNSNNYLQMQQQQQLKKFQNQAYNNLQSQNQQQQQQQHQIQQQNGQFQNFSNISQLLQTNNFTQKKKPSMDNLEPMSQSGIQQQKGNVYNNQNNVAVNLQIPNQYSNEQIKNIMQLLKRLGEPLFFMSQYLSTEAIEAFNKLPQNHFNTGWVLSSIGRCYMEIVKYNEAEKHYAEAFKIESHRLEGIEYYSSCLWHLKKQVELCYLAHSALEKSTFAAETWIAVGNCFSLQKEHENALKFFNRAIQLNSLLPYGHSLCGSEYMFNEDFQKARKCFENALNLDIRHYNSWWGLGNIYYKQEKYDRAAEHFLKAIQINQRNPVLYSFMGMTLAAKREYIEALKYFESSEKLDPNNGLNRFQKANALVKLEKYKEALEELNKLYFLMPKESPIPILIGKIYKKLNMIAEAQKFFELALDLEHKDPQRIKALIDSLHNTNNEFSEDLDM